MSMKNSTHDYRKTSNAEKIPIGGWLNEPAALLEQKESKRILRSAVDHLPHKLKTAFVLNQFEGLSAEEISKILKVPLNTIEVRIHRAKRKLQSILIEQIKKK